MADGVLPRVGVEREIAPREDPKPAFGCLTPIDDFRDSQAASVGLPARRLRRGTRPGSHSLPGSWGCFFGRPRGVVQTKRSEVFGMR